ncbi:C40 family peptidase [Pseudotenacibaculum sp. MALMAid0570]|uniref:C40 family peptidase n=1 Tax=Pseudotenacibaculum sp. MALMAid0570 TaxID=3143938 RepID=UPI0032DE6E61
MSFGICNLSIVPLRSEPSDASEMVSQVLLGEHFTIIEKTKKWSKIQIHFDEYEGYIDNKQYEEIDKDLFDKLSTSDYHYSSELLDYITDNNNHLSTISIGSRLPFYEGQKFSIGQKEYSYEGNCFHGKLDRSEIIRTAFMFLNTPYLWGGKTPFGIDCSGFTQMVYKLCGYPLLRDAKDQATQGEVLSFIEESEPGDLAFFDNEEGVITHVGIIMNDYYIIHAHGKVRIDVLDHSGIYNTDTKTHTHKLRVIKKII